MFAIGERLTRWILPIIAASAVTTGAAQSTVGDHTAETDWFGDGSLVVQLDKQGNPTGDTLQVVYHQLLPDSSSTKPSTSQLQTGGLFNLKVLPNNTRVQAPGKLLLLETKPDTGTSILEYAIQPSTKLKKIESVRI